MLQDDWLSNAPVKKTSMVVRKSASMRRMLENTGLIGAMGKGGARFTVKQRSLFVCFRVDALIFDVPSVEVGTLLSS